MSLQNTHPNISSRLCGTPTELTEGRARVEMELLPEMAADERGLVHGGFTFGLADYAAMLAVNEPTVVLGKATVKFLKPTSVGERVSAEATVESSEGAKHTVKVTVSRGDETVFAGEFICFVPRQHVLEG